MLPVVEIFINAVGIVIFCALPAAIVWLIRVMRKQQQQTKVIAKSEPPKPSNQGRKPAPYRHVPTRNEGSDRPRQVVPVPLQEKLLSLTNGDRGTATRLVEHTRKNNPRQPETWLWEKVIYDLERDRL